jgi:hypothetical protein
VRQGSYCEICTVKFPSEHLHTCNPRLTIVWVVPVQLYRGTDVQILPTYFSCTAVRVQLATVVLAKACYILILSTPPRPIHQQ